MRSSGKATTQAEGMHQSGRAGAAVESHRWIDDEGKRMTLRYVESLPWLNPDDMMKTLLDWRAKTLKWLTTHTCLKFEKISLPFKNQTDIDKWCWEDVPKKDKILYMRDPRNVGSQRDFGVSPKKDDRCVIWKLSKLGIGSNEAIFGEKLGLLNIVLRPDRDTYISYNYENMNQIITSKSYVTYAMKCFDEGASVPVPMDFLSVMSDYSYIWTNADTVPVIVSRDPYQQYLLEYKNYQSPPPSPLDLQTLNLMYKCTDDWAAACREGGKEVPKCKNYGYVTKACVCSCLPVYTGKLCETKTSTNFPYPLQEGAFNYTITEGGVYDIDQLLPLRTPADPNLKKITFVIVKLEPKGKNALPFISVRWHPDGTEALRHRLHRDEKYAIERTNLWDCNWGVRMMWGSDNNDKGRRLACECTSMFGFNEPKEYARVLSARSENMTLTYINRLGAFFNDEALAIDTTKFILEAEFRAPPKLTPKQNRSSDDGGDGGGGVVGGVNGTESPLTATAAAMTAAGGAGGMAAVIGAVTALLLLCLLCLLLMKRRKKKKKLDELGEEEEEDSEGSGSGSDEN